MEEKIKSLLDVKKNLDKKRPRFVQQDAHKKKRLDPDTWKRPRGLQSKVRLNKKGYRKPVSIGYGSPALLKGLHRSGLKIVKIYNKAQVGKVDPKTEGIVLNSSIGLKSRIIILKEAIEKKITILNIKDAQKYLKECEDTFKARVDAKKARTETKKEKKKSLDERAKKAEKKKKDEEKEKADMTDEEKKELEKEERDKVLTAKDSGY